MENKRKYGFPSILSINSLVFAIIFCCLFLILNIAFAFDDLTNEQIVTAQHNGIITAMCYVLNIITGNVMRAIMGVFVIGTGWMFLVGGIKDWKPILFLAIATTLIIGGGEMANIISGNDIGCKKIYEVAEINKNVINNGGDCYVSDINLYMPAQQWYKCGSSEADECEDIIDDDTIIDGGDYIILKNCQPGSFKENENISLKYQCNKDNGKFTLINKSDIEVGRCKEACTVKDLSSKLNIFNAINISAKASKYKIKSGYLKQNQYFTQKTVIDLDCKNGYVEYDKDDNISIDGVTAVCETNATFNIIGSCRPKCKLKNSTYNNQVAKWQKYNKATDTWVDTEDVEFYYNEKIRIKNCNEEIGYFFPKNLDIEGNIIEIKDEEKAVMVCGGDGSWISEGSGKVVCSKNCNVRSYKYFSSNKWKVCDKATNYCGDDLKDGNFTFQAGDTLEVGTCLDNSYSIYTNKDVDKLRITCKPNGYWEENGGERCHKKCSITDIKNFDRASNWILCDKNKNCEGVNTFMKVCENGECKDILNLAEVEHRYYVKQNFCIDDYHIDEYSASEFVCKDGKFSRKSGTYDEVCRLSCQFSELSKIDEFSYIWKRSKSNGDSYTDAENVVNLTKIESNNSYALYNHYYKIAGCTDNRKVFGNEGLVAKCDEGGKWSVNKNENNKCYPNCNLSIINDEYVKTWGIYSAVTGTFRDLTETEKTNGLANGTNIHPIECNDGYSLNDSIKQGFNFQCKNGDWIKTTNIVVCYKDCSASQLEMERINNVSSFVNMTTNSLINNNSVIKHGEEIAVETCASGFILQNRKAVFICKNGEMKTNNNDVATVCSKPN